MPVPPPTAPTPSGTAGAVSGGPGPPLQPLGEVVVEGVPDRLASVSRSVVLSGMIAAQKDGGALVIRTQVGDVVIRSPIPLPLDRVLTLQIPPGAPPVRAQIAVVGAGGSAGLMTPALALPVASSLLPASASPPVPASPPSPASGVALPDSARETLLPPSPLVADLLPVVQKEGISSPLLRALPLLPGSIASAQILASPTPITGPVSAPPPAPVSPSMPSSPPVTTPSSPAAAPLLPVAQAVVEAAASRSAPAVLGSVLTSGLADLIAHLPPAILRPVSIPDARHVSPSGAISPALPSALPPTGGIGAIPAFSSFPAVLALPPGAQITVQVERITLPSLPPAVPAALSVSTPPAESALPGGTSAPPLLPALVIGATPRGEPLLTSPAGLLVLGQHDPLPVGTRVDVTVLDVRESSISPLLPRDQGLPPPPPKDWPVLQQMVAQLPPDVLPPPSLQIPPAGSPPHMGGQMLFLLAALGLKDPKAYVGEAVTRWLGDTGQTGRLLALSSEMQQIAQTWFRPPDTPQTEWRSFALPVPPDGSFLRLAVHSRQEDSSGQEGEDKNAPRRGAHHLVVEVEMSRLGPLVLDGLIRTKRFDLTLRSQRRLPPPVQEELQGAFTNTLSAMAWTGGMTFQTSADVWRTPTR